MIIYLFCIFLTPAGGLCPQSPPLPAAGTDLQFPSERHKRGIVWKCDRCLNHERQDGAETADPHTPKLMTWLTLAAEKEALLHPLPICLGLNTHQSNESSIQQTSARAGETGLLRTETADKEIQHSFTWFRQQAPRNYKEFFFC